MSRALQKLWYRIYLPRKEHFCHFNRRFLWNRAGVLFFSRTVSIFLETFWQLKIKQLLINSSFSVNSWSSRKLAIFKRPLTFFTLCKFHVEALRFFIPEMSFVCQTMLHIKKLGGTHNKEHIRTYTPRMCAYRHTHTAISVNVVRSKHKATKQDRKVIWGFFLTHFQNQPWLVRTVKIYKGVHLVERNFSISSRWGSSYFEDVTKNNGTICLKSFKFWRRESK